jgi:putative transposase
VYLNLVHDDLEASGVRVLAWCLMTNHVHWVVIPERDNSLATLFRRVHGRYAQYLNARRGRSGHLWQNRFFSCALAPEREETAIRYVEWNPLRAGLAKLPEQYMWSSAADHLAGPDSESIRLLDWSYWLSRGGAEGWRMLLGSVEDVRDTIELRERTHAGAPFGSEAFVKTLEARFGRQWLREGRPKEAAEEAGSGTERSVTLLAS